MMMNKAKTCYLTLYIYIFGNETAEKKAEEEGKESQD